MPQDVSPMLDSPVPPSHTTLQDALETTGSLDSKVELLAHTLPQLSSESHRITSSPLEVHIPHNIVNGIIPVETISSAAHDVSLGPAVNVSKPQVDHSIVVPSSTIEPPSPRDTSTLLDSDTKQTLPATTHTDSQPTIHTSSQSLPDKERTTSTQLADAAATETHEGNMIFRPTTNVLQRRRNYATTNAMTDYEADLTSKDRAKQKEAVKKYLMDRVRQDWTWEWPRPQPRSDESSPERAPEQLDDEFVQGNWKERDEWLSNASESEGEPMIPASASSPDTPTPTSKSSPFRFESPDGVGMTIQKIQLERKRRRKKRLTDEVAFNDGLRCFVARRDAWTGARRVSRAALGFEGANDAIDAKEPPRTPVRSQTSEDEGSSTAVDPEEEDNDDEWEDEIEIPIAPPLIPPENAMRASILPSAYGTIYDKVVVQSLSPSCPMNLKDITRSCVQGWKRDGEWPPKSSVPETGKKGRKMSIASLFTKHEKPEKEIAKPAEKEKDNEKKAGAATGIRKGLQKILSLGHSPKETAHTNGTNEHSGKGKSVD